jgi:hypothetical protein
LTFSSHAIASAAREYAFSENESSGSMSVQTELQSSIREFVGDRELCELVKAKGAVQGVISCNAGMIAFAATGRGREHMAP